MSAVRVRAFVDRFEGDRAVLLLGDRESEAVVWPRAFLPPDAAEGTVIEMTVETDVDETADASQKIRRMLNDLGD